MIVCWASTLGPSLFDWVSTLVVFLIDLKKLFMRMFKYLRRQMPCFGVLTFSYLQTSSRVESHGANASQSSPF